MRQVAYTCVRCKQLRALRDRGLKTRVAELEEIRVKKRYIEGAFRDTVMRSHLPSENFCAAKEDESLGAGKHQDGAEGSDPIVGTHPPEEIMVFSRTKDTSSVGRDLSY